LGLVLLAALEEFERFLLERGFAGPLAHFGHALLVGCQFGVEFG